MTPPPGPPFGPAAQPRLFGTIAADARAFRAGMGGRLTWALTPGFHFVLGIRIWSAIARVPIVGKPLRRILWFWHCLIFGSEVAIGATIGAGFFVPHPFGIVIGKTRIGQAVTVLQHVTVGNKSRFGGATAVIENSVFLGAGAVVIGDITVGAGAMVGANAVVVRDVPAGATAVGNPAHILPAQEKGA